MIDDTAMKDRILDAILPNVAFDGWMARSIRLGLEDAGLDAGAADRAFPGGVNEMIRYWSSRCNVRMASEMAEIDASPSAAAMGTTRRIATATKLRILAEGADREAVRRTLVHLALPANAGMAAGLLYRTCDAIWYAAGDHATDFSYYTKRATLAAVYAATLLYWLDDESEGFEATWAFLDRRLSDLGRMPRLRARLDQKFRSAAAPLAGLRGLVPSRGSRP